MFIPVWRNRRMSGPISIQTEFLSRKRTFTSEMSKKGCPWCKMVRYENVWLTEAGLGIGIDVLVFTPLHHTFQDGHQTFKALLSQCQLLNEDEHNYFIWNPDKVASSKIPIQEQLIKKLKRNLNHLLRCYAEFVSSTTLSYFWKVVDQTFKDVSSV